MVQKVDCSKNPDKSTNSLCIKLDKVKSKFSVNPIHYELLAMLEQFEADLNTDEGPSGELVITLAKRLRQECAFDDALWILDMLPRQIPQLTTTKDTLMLSQGMLLRARILDQMPERAFEAENAFAFAGQFAIMVGRLERG